MRCFSKIRLFAFAFAVVLAAHGAKAGEGVVSTMKNVNAVWQARGFFLTPAPEFSGEQNPGDLAPVQAFEIIRPRNETVTIGRLHTSCTCVVLESPKKTFEPGERAILKLRNVISTPAGGQRYAIYVQLTRPIRTTLRFDTFVQSGSGQYITESEVKKDEPTPDEKKSEDNTDKDAPGEEKQAESSSANGEKSDEPVVADQQNEAREAAEATAAQDQGEGDAAEVKSRQKEGGEEEFVEILEGEIPGGKTEVSDDEALHEDIDPEMSEEAPDEDVEKVTLKAKEDTGAEPSESVEK